VGTPSSIVNRRRILSDRAALEALSAIAACRTLCVRVYTEAPIGRAGVCRGWRCPEGYWRPLKTSI
jgi:hypothetical protein